MISPQNHVVYSCVTTFPGRFVNLENMWLVGGYECQWRSQGQPNSHDRVLMAIITVIDMNL